MAMISQADRPNPPKSFFYLLDTRPRWLPPSTTRTNTTTDATTNAPPQTRNAYGHDDRTRNAINSTPTAQIYLSALPEEERTKINRFHFHRDGKLALGSAILKRWFVCRALSSSDLNCGDGRGDVRDGNGRVKWQDMRFGRRVTALDRREGVKEDSERGKPSYLPPSSGEGALEGKGDVELDFNTSHQAGLVVLGGYRFQRSHLQHTKDRDALEEATEGVEAQLAYSIGVDVTCTSERMERDLEMIRKESEPGPGLQAHRGISTLPSGIPIRGVQPGGMRAKNEGKRLEAGFAKFVDMHEEVFSQADVEAMKAPLSADKDVSNADEDFGGLKIRRDEGEANGGGDEEERGLKHVKTLLRRFYAYWALKEAYVKMEGEALLAGWLKEVEFRDVRVPKAAADQPGKHWGETVEGIGVYLRGKKRENVQMFLQACENDYLFATAVIRSRDLPGVEVPRWEYVDVEKNILPLCSAE